MQAARVPAADSPRRLPHSIIAPGEWWRIDSKVSD